MNPNEVMKKIRTEQLSKEEIVSLMNDVWNFDDRTYYMKHMKLKTMRALIKLLYTT